MESIGFKEWALVCEALGRGEQAVILRKGGLAESRNGFAFQHREFFLFPTFFHEQVDRLRVPNAEIPPHSATDVQIRYFAKIEAAKFITSWETVSAINSLHILQPGVVRERFDYEGTEGINVAFVRVFRLVPAWTFPNDRRFGGCRSWVTLPSLLSSCTLDPVLTDDEHRQRFDEFRALTRHSCERLLTESLD